MRRSTLVLRDGSGTERQVEVGQDGSVTVGERVVHVEHLRAGAIRVGNRVLWAARDGDTRWVFLDGQVYIFEEQRSRGTGRRAARHDAGLSAPMPATVLKIRASPGDAVRAGDAVIILEAMKMELPVRATADGVVSAIRCREGELVQPGQDLIDITPASEPHTRNEPAEGTG